MYAGWGMAAWAVCAGWDGMGWDGTEGRLGLVRSGENFPRWPARPHSTAGSDRDRRSLTPTFPHVLYNPSWPRLWRALACCWINLRTLHRAIV